jgi:hypothetical protein
MVGIISVIKQPVPFPYKIILTQYPIKDQFNQLAKNKPFAAQ